MGLYITSLGDAKETLTLNLVFLLYTLNWVHKRSQSLRNQ